MRDELPLENRLRVGSRVQISQRGPERLHLRRDYGRGVIVGESRDGRYWRVMFERLSYPKTLHKSFLEKST